MRKLKKEADLKEIALNISKEIVIREYIDGSSYDERRKTTSVERDIIFNIAYSSLLALNDNETVRSECAAEKAIVSAAEYTMKRFISECNGYDTIYIPLNNAIEEWEKEGA